MTRFRSRFIISLFFIACLGGATRAHNGPKKDASLSLSVPLGGMPVVDQVDALIKKPFRCGTLSYESDTPFERAEFLYLMGFDSGNTVTAEALKKAVGYLARKNKFCSIALRLSGGSDVKNIHVELKSFWTFERLTVSGIWHGRDKYRYLYELDPGEAFDEKKHKHSLELMREELRKQGYLHVRIDDAFVMDHGSKSLSVNLVIKSGPRFRIGQAQVHFSGHDSLSHGELVAVRDKVERFFVRRLEGKLYSSYLLNKAGKNIKKFLVKKGFLQAEVVLEERVGEEAVDLVIRIPLHAKKEFVFFGNHFFSDLQLQEQILAFGQSTLLVPTSFLAGELEDLYKKNGFLWITVESREEDTHCFFVTNEGPRAMVEAVELKGVSAVSREAVSSAYRTYFRKNSFLNDQTCKRIMGDIEAWYHKEGFALARVSCEPRTTSGSPRVVLVMQVDEGKRYFWNTISIPAFPEFEGQGPFLIHAQAGHQSPFDSGQLYVQRRWLADNLHKRGYLYVDIKPKVNVLAGTHGLVDVTWDIVLHQDKVVFGKTVVVGSCPLPFKQLMRELSYREGQTWNKMALEKSLLRLRDLSLFSNIHVYPENIARAEPEKVILAKLVEDDPFELRLRGGVLGVARNLAWREGATYKIGGSLLCKNIFDSGGQLRFDADLTKFERYMSAHYIYPWLFDMPYTTITKVYSNRYRQPVVQGSNEQLYVAIQQGFLFGLSRKYTRMTTGLNCGLEWMETQLKNRAAARAIDFSPALVDEKIPYFYLEPSFVVDYLDDKLNPTLGSFTFASLKGVVPLRKVDETYLKFSIEQSFFYPIYRDIIAGFRFRVGHIFNQCFSQIMPPERFYLGGANSVRGYNPDFCPPLGCFEDSCGRKRLVPQGGKSMLNMNVELRFPLANRLNGAFFQDAGVLIGDDFAHIHEQVVAATGAGLRYNTPVGPLRFDVGFKWKKLHPHDSRVAWFLTLGNIF